MNSKLQMPALLPKELRHYQDAGSQENLYSTLIKRPDEATSFLETAFSDETWSADHGVFIGLILKEFSDQYSRGDFPWDFAKRLAQAIQPHYSILERYLPDSLLINLQDTSIEINPILFGTASSHFEDILFQRKGSEVTLTDTPFSLFHPVLEFLRTGTVRDIWKRKESELLELLHKAAQWRIAPLSELIQETLKRYIDRDHVLDLLLLAQQNKWGLLRSYCYEKANEYTFDCKFHPSGIDHLAFEFYHFTDEAFKIFDQIKPWITILTISGKLTSEPLFPKVISQCPNLKTIDLTGSENFNEYFEQLPRDLIALNLAQCAWLSNPIFKKITAIFPQLQWLSLASNPQLSTETWASLSKLRNLKNLDLARCHQIHDQDFKLILKSFSGGTDLNLDECKKISDRAFFEMAKTNPRFVTLNLSRCSIGDIPLIEIGLRSKRLTHINLTRCETITEKGVVELVKHAISLKELNITRCEISRDTINEIQSTKPLLNIIF